MNEWKQEEVVVLLMLSGNQGKSRLEGRVCGGSTCIVSSVSPQSLALCRARLRQSVNNYGEAQCWVRGIVIAFAFKPSYRTSQISKHIARYDLVFSQFYIRYDVNRTHHDSPPHTHTLQIKKIHRNFVICPEINWPVGAITTQTWGFNSKFSVPFTTQAVWLLIK